MALDSRQKRQSAVSFLVPSLIPGVVPTGTIDQAERQVSVWVYSGILAGSALPVPNCILFTSETFTTPKLDAETFTTPKLDDETFTTPKLDDETWDC